MPLFVAVITHHDLALRSTHMRAHIDWLDAMVQDGSVVLSGPLQSGPLASDAPAVAMLVLRAHSPGSAMQTMATDPFFIHGVTSGLTLTEWDPIFGLLADESGGRESLGANSS